MQKSLNQSTLDIEYAAQEILRGNLVSFPTETVYGLGADAHNPRAIAKVFEAKGRPADHPLIVHIGHPEQLSQWAINIPDVAWQLADHFWPGPLTLLLHKHPDTSPLITGGKETIAIRMPDHATALELLALSNTALVGPSANVYGHVSPTLAEHVAKDFNHYPVTILDGGACQVGIESTIISLLSETPVVLRQGHISPTELSKVIGHDIASSTPTSMQTIACPGNKSSHYAPKTPVRLLGTNALLKFLSTHPISNHGKFVVLGCSSALQDSVAHSPSKIIYAPQTPGPYAQQLYANLRILDHYQAEVMLIEDPSNAISAGDDWGAVMDRLKRASS